MTSHQSRSSACSSPTRCYFIGDPPLPTPHPQSNAYRYHTYQTSSPSKPTAASASDDTVAAIDILADLPHTPPVGHGRTSSDPSVHSRQDTLNLEQQSLPEAFQIERDHLTAERNELQSKLASALKEIGDLNAQIVRLQERVDKTSSELTADIVVPMQTSILDNLSKLSATDSIAAATSSVLGSFVESRRTTLGIFHPATLDLMTSLANSLQKQGRVVEAEPIYKQCLELREQALGPGHASTLSS